ncbi:MAG: glycosyltransferase family 4 protein [Deltaproteobacteria bacterium]|nr:glycosyltransferase family 4 protein [Deltaproteobacteria bacterium]
MRKKSPLRICMMVTYDLTPRGGGVKVHAVRLAQALRRLGDEVTIIGPASAPVSEPGMHGLRGVVNVPSNGSDNYLGIFVCPYQIRRFFREHAFDVIHVHEPHNPTLSYWSTWMTRDIPHVATFHAFAEQESRSRLFARRFFGTTLLPWFQRAIAVSPAASRYASQAWKGPLSIIPNGVPTSLFRPAPPRDQLPLRLLFVGRLGDERKGVRFLIEAYERLQRRGVPVTLDVVGELGGAPTPPALPGLTYHGSVDFQQLVERYHQCDVLVAPSTGQESFGIILLEAMASAKPIICSDIEGYRQVVVREGSLLTPPGDAAALEQQIESFVALEPALRRRMGAANLAHVQQYDWDNIARSVRGEYQLAMGHAVEPLELPVVQAPLAPPAEEARPVVSATGTR